MHSRSDCEFLITALRTASEDFPGAVSCNENIGAPAVMAPFDLVFSFFERRYWLFAILMAPGRLREEVLANVAHQLVELRVYFDSFIRYLANRSVLHVPGGVLPPAGAAFTLPSPMLFQPPARGAAWGVYSGPISRFQ